MKSVMLAMISAIVLAGLGSMPEQDEVRAAPAAAPAHRSTTQADRQPQATSQPTSAADVAHPASASETAPASQSAGTPAVHREKIAEADALMLEAMASYHKLPSADRSDTKAQRQVLGKLLNVIRDYPQSDQVSNAYFFAAELLKEYIDDPKSAVEYYQRAYQADPAAPNPARFQRATVLDYRLHKPAEALEEYRAVLRFEAGMNTRWARSNADFAAARIRKLTGQE